MKKVFVVLLGVLMFFAVVAGQNAVAAEKNRVLNAARKRAASASRRTASSLRPSRRAASATRCRAWQ